LSYVFRPGAMSLADPATPRGWAEGGGRFIRLYRGTRIEVWRAGAWWYAVNGLRCPKGCQSRDEAMRRALKAARKAGKPNRP
jgi:hypothetical protein